MRAWLEQWRRRRQARRAERWWRKRAAAWAEQYGFKLADPTSDKWQRARDRLIVTLCIAVVIFAVVLAVLVQEVHQ